MKCTALTTKLKSSFVSTDRLSFAEKQLVSKYLEIEEQAGQTLIRLLCKSGLGSKLTTL